VNPEFSIIIPNWNGIAFLQRCVSATLLSAQATRLPHEIIVVDDASTDGSADIVANEFPSVKLIRNEQNIGFGASVNRGVRQASAPLVVLLNNDLSPRESMIRELVEPLREHPDVFAVSAKTLDWYTGEPNHVNMFAKIVDGLFRLAYEDSTDICETLFFQGGSCALRRDAFLEFGGFADVFHPGYWEDYDISYLAVKSGWKVLYNPHALALHVGQGSMKRAYGAERIARVKFRNGLLFQWLNFSDPIFVRCACRGLAPELTSAFRDGRNTECAGAIEALNKLPDVLALRKKREQLWQLSDEEIFQKFAHRGCLC